jgi:hypothetical protein
MTIKSVLELSDKLRLAATLGGKHTARCITAIDSLTSLAHLKNKVIASAKGIYDQHTLSVPDHPHITININIYNPEKPIIVQEIQ